MHKPILVSSLVGVALIALFECGGGTSTTITPHTPKVHRPSAMMCDNMRPPGIADAGLGPEAGVPDSGLMNCNQDSDCTQGKDGRCSYTRIGKQCTYDTCFSDSDCMNGAVCECRTNPQDSSPNHCVGTMGTDTCRVDSDCGANSWCSPSFGTCGNYGGIQGYFCHKTTDTCIDDSDCNEGGLNGFCMYEPTVKHWQCSYSACAG
jgi:hypothetical protein